QSRFKAALAEAMRASTLANQYVSDQAPWSTIKVDRERAATVLNVSLRCVDSLKILFTPFLPFSSQTVHELLGYDDVLAGELEFPALALARARAVGVERVIAIGSGLASARATQTLAASEQGVFVALGIHPHQAGDDEPLAELRRLLDDSVALGEIGLDFYRDYAPHEAQGRLF